MSFMDLPPSDIGLEEVIKECPNKWDKIAIRVGVSINDTEAIFNDRKAKVTALKNWRDGLIDNPQDHPATWKHLLSAIRGSCGYRVADKLQEEAGKNPSWTNFPRKNAESRHSSVHQPSTRPSPIIQQADVRSTHLHPEPVKEDELEKNWDMQTRHGELIVEKWKWDAVARCVIQGSYMGTDEHFTAFLVKWERKCYFATCYHSYLDKDVMPMNKENPWCKPEELKQDDTKKNKIGKAVLRSEYRFLYSDGDNVPHARKGSELVKNGKIFINCARDIVVVEVKDSGVFLKKVEKAFDKQFDAKDLLNRSLINLGVLADCFDFLNLRTAIIWHHPLGKELCRSSGDILSESKNKKQFIEEGKIAYHVRTEGGSSGSPVLVTYKFQEENWPVIVGVHARYAKGEKNRWNYGHFLLPFLSNIHEYLAGNEQLKDEYVTFVLQEEA